jgi:hypothetical protein
MYCPFIKYISKDQSSLQKTVDTVTNDAILVTTHRHIDKKALT